MRRQSPEEMSKNMDSVYEEYGLSNVIGGVDGCHFHFWNVRGIYPLPEPCCVRKPQRILLNKFQIIERMNRNVIYFVLYYLTINGTIDQIAAKQHLRTTMEVCLSG